MSRLTRLLALCAYAICGGCLPLSQSYYVPSAEGAKVASSSCGGGPPYVAGIAGGGFQLSVLLQPALLAISIHTRPGVKVHFDLAQMRIDADGKSLATQSAQLRTEPTATAPAHAAAGTIDVNTGYSNVEMSLNLRGSKDVIVHLPPIAVDGTVTRLPDIFFRWEKHTNIVTIVGNC
jgi:hypothetical protein